MEAAIWIVSIMFYCLIGGIIYFHCNRKYEFDVGMLAGMFWPTAAPIEVGIIIGSLISKSSK